MSAWEARADVNPPNCPLCGLWEPLTALRVQDKQKYWTLTCGGCGLSVASDEQRIQPIDIWNMRRAPEDFTPWREREMDMIDATHARFCGMNDRKHMAYANLERMDIFNWYHRCKKWNRPGTRAGQVVQFDANHNHIPEPGE